MHTVLRIDLESLAAIGFLDDLVDTCRTVALSRFIIHWQIHFDGNGRIFQVQMTGLVFAVISVG